MARAQRSRISGVIAGLGATVLMAVAYLIMDRNLPPELLALDNRFRFFNKLQPAPEIVHVDIDDASIDRIGRWPWPRLETADLIRVLHELGARLIVIDLLLDDPQGARIVDPRLTPYASAEGSIEVQGDSQIEVFDDLELMAAIRSAGNVLLSVQGYPVAPGMPDPLDQRLAETFARDPGVSVDDAIERLDIPDDDKTRGVITEELLRLRLQGLLMTEFTLDEQECARRLGIPLDAVRRALPRAKTRVARERVGRILERRPEASPEEILKDVLGEAAGQQNADREDVKRAIVRKRSEAGALARLPSAPARAGERLYRTHEIDPPFRSFIDNCLDIGTVNFTADPDGLVRRIPLAIVYRDRLLKHLGLTAACRALGLRDPAIQLVDGALRVSDAGGTTTIDIPVNDAGQMIIHWTKEARRWRADRDIKHYPASMAWSIAATRRQIRDNELRMEMKLADLILAVTGMVDPEYESMVQRRNALRAELHKLDLQNTTSGSERQSREEEISRLTAQLDQRHRDAEAAVRMQLKDLPPDLTPDDWEKDKSLQAIGAARKILEEELPRYRRANADMERAVQTLIAEYAAKFRDKVVFLGFAATATGDIVSTPIDPQTNGVMCHAYVYNTIVQRAFIRTAPRWIEVLALLALGALVTVLTVKEGPWVSLIATVTVMVGFVAINALGVFLGMSTWMVVALPVGTILLCWATVTVYRQLTAERDRRVFAQQLGQYTSPVLAARIAESEEAAAAFKAVQSREITCMFSDLQGFTSISERETAETVQHVLNTYLERMSRVIWKGRGLINKFIGDGIMAFFNASVDPLDDHPRAACETAVNLLAELDRLKTEHGGNDEGRVYQQLRMRIGLSTGLCKNGDFGSELKADYTIIGDVVNLAARLEPANKVFNTQLMVSGPLRDAVQNDYEFRYLAELQVKGKARTVPVYELIARKGQLSEADREYVRRFEAGVRLYQARKWDECIVHFTRLLVRRPDDAGASRYIDACQEFKAFPPDGEWAGALELKEK